ncbi:Hypothetical predicted protein [Olea europaea subsp. europaea]|uniref:Uncharacterized protein n=1 Tax=Olea europaea subsp. europaea TaxID=158383 RepID=A0A8S0THH4_OLEEU|nr:Hypothetical predicted protein [Olea europaea subsp. europaea]
MPPLAVKAPPVSALATCFVGSYRVFKVLLWKCRYTIPELDAETSFCRHYNGGLKGLQWRVGSTALAPWVLWLRLECP